MMSSRSKQRSQLLATVIAGTTLALVSCRAVEGIDPANPARGPGALVDNGEPVSDGDFVGGADAVPAPRDVAPPAGEGYVECDMACQSYCDENPGDCFTHET